MIHVCLHLLTEDLITVYGKRKRINTNIIVCIRFAGDYVKTVDYTQRL